MIDIRSIPPPLTRIDQAPKPVSRTEPEGMPASHVNAEAKPQVERRRNPDRRGGRKGKGPMDRRTGADRRRHTVDISV